MTSTPIGGSNEILEDGKNGLIIDLVDGKKPNSENLCEVVPKTMKARSQNEKLQT